MKTATATKPKSEVKPDWRIVKCSWKSYCEAAWLAENKIDECGIFYLIDVNLHVHICSLTPNLEAWSLIPYVTFTEELPDDGGERAFECEQVMMVGEEPVSYFGTEAKDWKFEPASKYINIPEQEDGEEDEKYRMRVADEVREYLQGNPCWF